MPLAPPDPTWAPRIHTPSRYDRTDGPDVADFAATLLTVPKGELAGRPLVFAAWQKWLVSQLLERRTDGKLRYSKAVVGLARKNGKSLIGSALAADHLFFGPQGAEVYSAAKDRMQARIVFDETKKQVLGSAPLKRLAKVYRDAIEVPSRGSVYRALSADGGSAQGLNPSLVIADEVHVWPSGPNTRAGDDLWAALTEGSGARPEALVVAITTAGATLDSLLGRLYEHGQAVAAGEIDDESFGLFWWSAPDEADIHDREAWKAANPNLAEGLVNVENLESSSKSTAWPDFRRFRMNQWVSLSGENLVPTLQWRDARRPHQPIKPGARITLGFDGSVSDDATALVATEVGTGHQQLIGLWEPDPTDPEWIVPRDEVDETLTATFVTYDVAMLWADPAFWESELIDWEKRWPRRIERIPMSTQRVAPMVTEWLADLAEGRLTHCEDPRFTRHIHNTVAKETPTGITFRKEKRGSKRKVDAFSSSLLSNGARHMNEVTDSRRGKRRAIVLSKGQRA